MRETRGYVVFAAAIAAVLSFPARPALAEAPSTDTVLAGHCSTAAIDQPDSSAEWLRVAKQWSHELPGAWSNDSLRDVLLALGKADQDARNGMTAEKMKDSAFARRLMRGDSARSAHMNAILNRYGWPGKSMVGVDGETAAFHLVQHSATLGARGLALMQAARPGEVSPADLALVADRQQTNAGRPQIYGSQLDVQHTAALRFFPIADELYVDERRATMGLPPLRPYACMIATMYSAPVVMPDSGHK
ncbi:MAG: DUF6624 domain-containing protein [Gemmatimonadales bacterium]